MGETKLQDGKLIPKHHPTIQAMAALDEVNAHIGIIKSKGAKQAEWTQIQKNIMTIMTLISTGKKTSANSHFGAGWEDFFIEETQALESRIDAVCAMMPSLTSFVTYGASPMSATLDLARAVARRAETYLSKAVDSDYVSFTFSYINRLSDFMYVMARYADFEDMVVTAVENALKDSNPQPVATQELSLPYAKSILEKIEHKASGINLPVAIACANAAGNIVALHVMDGTLPISPEAAMAKAFTAAVVKMPTLELSKLVQPGQPFFGLESLGGGKLLPIGGGVPLYNQAGQLVGAIGVSGGTAQQDHKLAEATHLPF